MIPFGSKLGLIFFEKKMLAVSFRVFCQPFWPSSRFFFLHAWFMETFLWNNQSWKSLKVEWKITTRIFRLKPSQFSHRTMTIPTTKTKGWRQPLTEAPAYHASQMGPTSFVSTSLPPSIKPSYPRDACVYLHSARIQHTYPQILFAYKYLGSLGGCHVGK